MSDMEPAAKVHAYFCGHLDTPYTADDVMKSGLWERVVLSQRQYDEVSSIYYSSFVNSMAAHLDSDGSAVVLGNIYDNKCHLRHRPQAGCDISCPGAGVCRIVLESLDLYFMPHGICMWSLHVTHDTPISLIPPLHRCLRDSVSVLSPDSSSSLSSGLADVLGLLRQIGATGTDSDLLLSGNKLKIFQHIQTDTVSDEKLFELGCLTDIGSVNGSDMHWRPSEGFYRSIIDRHRISVYSDWQALCLVDTFTILAGSTAGWSAPYEGYFRYIYLNCLYQKIVLFEANRNFRNSSDRETLSRQFRYTVEQDRRYSFTQISYNFLPQLVYECVDRGLGVTAERNELHTHVRRAAELRAKQAERRLALALGILTVFSIISVVFDTLELLRNYFGFDREALLYGLKICVPLLIAVFGGYAGGVIKRRNGRG